EGGGGCGGEVTRMTVEVVAVDDGSGGEVEVTWWRRLLWRCGEGGGFSAGDSGGDGQNPTGNEKGAGNTLRGRRGGGVCVEAMDKMNETLAH
ncbi:hypothetical protein Tco_1464577, partial [Tanacetum coccineum]